MHTGLEAGIQRAYQGQRRDWLVCRPVEGLTWQIFLFPLENSISHTSGVPYQTFRASHQVEDSLPFWSGGGKGGFPRQILVNLVQFRLISGTR